MCNICTGYLKALAALLKNFKPRSISHKLTALVVLTVGVVAMLVAGLSITREIHRHARAKTDYLASSAAIFASATSIAVAANDAAGAVRALRGVARVPHVIFAQIKTLDDRLLAEIGSGIILDSDVRIQEGAAAPSLWDLAASKTVSYTTPIVQGGAVVGSLTLVADNSELAEELWRGGLTIAFAAMLALIAALLAAERIKSSMLKPLAHLSRAVRGIAASQDYAGSVERESDDEVGDLCEGFNHMLGEIRTRERRITDLALHDAESDLPNRLQFERMINAFKNVGGLRVICVLSVDRYFAARAAIGHKNASALIAEIGASLSNLGVIGVARLGQDAIGVLLNPADLVEASQLAAHLQRNAELPVRIGEHIIDVTLTLGLSVGGKDGDCGDTLIERAFVALDQAREARVKRKFFDAEIYGDPALNLTLISDMRRALQNGDLDLHFQPKLNLRSREIRGAEALLRWTCPTRGVVNTGKLIGVAEDTGAIRPLTDWTIGRAIEAQAQLRAANLDIRLSVNISGHLIGDDEFVQSALTRIDQGNAKLCFEITETAVINDPERALRNIQALSNAGVLISIDDYGAGLSSLSYLKQIPAHELKIDMGFITKLHTSKRDALLVKSTIDLAHSLGMSVTAEGVETETTLALLAGMGCDTAQGWLIAKALPLPELITFLHESAPTLRAAQTV